MTELKKKLTEKLIKRVFNHSELIDEIITDFKESEEFKQLILSSVSQRSELLKAEDKDVPFDDYVKRFFKQPKMELIYRSKRNNNMMTESQLIKYYKRAMCL